MFGWLHVSRRILNAGPLLWRLATRNVWRNPKRSWLTIFAIAAGIWSAVSLSTLARGVGEQFLRDSIRNLTGHIQIHSKGYVDDPSVDYRFRYPTSDILSALGDLKLSGLSARVRVPAIAQSERNSNAVVFVGVNPEDESRVSFFGDGVVKGRKLQSVTDDGIVVGEKLLKSLKTQVGHRIVILSERADATTAQRGFRIVGVYRAELEATERTYLFTGLRVAQSFLAMPGEVSELALLLESSEAIHDDVVSLKRWLPALDSASWESLQPLVVAVHRVQNGFLKIWATIVMITVSFGLMNTLFMAIFERSREIGLLQALGMQPSQIVIQIVLESVVLLFIGCVIGNLCGLATFVALGGGIDISAFARGTQHLGMSSMIFPRFVAVDWLIANLLVFVLGVISSLYPAWRAAQSSPAESIARQ